MGLRVAQTGTAAAPAGAAAGAPAPAFALVVDASGDNGCADGRNRQSDEDRGHIDAPFFVLLRRSSHSPQAGALIGVLVLTHQQIN